MPFDDRDLWWATRPGRGLPSGELSRDERRALDEELSGPRPVWGALMPQSEEERRWLNPDLRTWLPGFQGGHDLARGIGEGSPGLAAWGAGQVGLSLLPLGFRAPTPRTLPPRPVYTLSEMYPHTEPGRFRYDILRDGNRGAGSLTGRILADGETASISWIGRTGSQNELGISALRDLREVFRRDFPNVTRFTGDRVSGARWNAFNRTFNANPGALDLLPFPRQTLHMPSVIGAGGFALDGDR